jgi:hypothetical protein
VFANGRIEKDSNGKLIINCGCIAVYSKELGFNGLLEGKYASIGQPGEINFTMKGTCLYITDVELLD